MKKQLYKIVTESEPHSSKRSLIKSIKEFIIAKKVVADFVRLRAVYSFPLPSSTAIRVLSETRGFIKRELNKKQLSRYLIRRFQGRDIVVNIDIQGGLKEALDHIRHTIKVRRENNRFHGDSLRYRKPNYFLNKYKSIVLTKPKGPKTDAKYVGIEIECILPQDVDASPLLPFKDYVNMGTDGSVTYGRGEYGAEIRICLRKMDVRNILPGILAALVKMGAYVNKSCGLHVHLDQRMSITPATVFEKLVRSLNLLYTIVPKSRRKNNYCVRNKQINFDVARFDGRYYAINASAYSRYKTIEVRLFGGTLDATKIMNWIETLYAIAYGEMILRCPKNFDTARKYWKLSDENVRWLKERQEKFSEINGIVHESETESHEPSLTTMRRDSAYEFAYTAVANTLDISRQAEIPNLPEEAV